MNRLPAPLVIAVLLAGPSGFITHARSYSFESLTCLFQMAKPVRTESMLAFSFLPLAESLALHPPCSSLGKKVEVDPAQTTERPDVTPFELTRHWTEVSALRQAQPTDSMDSWPIFDALRKWRDNPNVHGLSHNFSNPNSFLALDYSDIFETGRAPYKGGHGISFFFEHAF
jgi:hypothetical protein